MAAFGHIDRARAALEELRADVDLALLPVRALGPLHARSADLGLTLAESAASKRAALEIWASNQQVVAFAQRLGVALSAEGCAPVAIKGLALVGDHTSLDQRSIGDIDMLVGVDELALVVAVLREFGHPVDFVPDSLALRQRHAVIAPGADRVVVDLHWRAGPGLPSWAVAREPEVPWPTARSAPAPSGHPLYGSGWRVLHPHDSLAVLAVHGCRAANGRAVHLMADAHVVLSGQDLDVARLLRALDEIGHLDRGTRWIRNIAELFGTDLPAGLVDRRWRPGENWAQRFERAAVGRTRSSGAGRVGLAVGLLAASASVTVGCPWRFPGQVVSRMRWERASRGHTRIEPPSDERW